MASSIQIGVLYCATCEGNRVGIGFEDHCRCAVCERVWPIEALKMRYSFQGDYLRAALDDGSFRDMITKEAVPDATDREKPPTTGSGSHGDGRDASGSSVSVFPLRDLRNFERIAGYAFLLTPRKVHVILDNDSWYFGVRDE